MHAAMLSRKEDCMKTSTLVRSSLLVLAAALTAAGCQTTDAYTGEKKVNNASKGAGIGALAGAILGAATGDNSKERRERALIGAGVGALTGAGVGAYRSEEHTSELQSLRHLVCRLLLEKNNNTAASSICSLR